MNRYFSRLLSAALLAALPGLRTAAAETNAPAPSEDEIARWRFSSTQFAVGPPGTLWAGRRASVVDRLAMELLAKQDDFPLLVRLLNDVQRTRQDSAA